MEGQRQPSRPRHGHERSRPACCSVEAGCWQIRCCWQSWQDATCAHTVCRNTQPNEQVQPLHKKGLLTHSKVLSRTTTRQQQQAQSWAPVVFGREDVDVWAPVVCMQQPPIGYRSSGRERDQVVLPTSGACMHTAAIVPAGTANK